MELEKNEVHKLSGGRQMKKLKIPKWCKKHEETNSNRDNLSGCCFCGEYTAYYQEGDGKRVHSLCKICYEKNKHDVKVLEDES